VIHDRFRLAPALTDESRGQIFLPEVFDCVMVRAISGAAVSGIDS
jgi:hypothetical protein